LSKSILSKAEPNTYEIIYFSNQKIIIMIRTKPKITPLKKPKIDSIY